MTTPSKHTPSKSKTGQRPPATPSGEASEQDQRDLSNERSQATGAEEDRGDPDQVEIGDPVPEDNRTIRARGRGETGEDEDLPGAARGGETGEDEDLPSDESGTRRPADPH